MNDRIRACSPLVALAIASVVALSACEQQSPPEPVAKVSGALSSFQPGDIAVTCLVTDTDAIGITALVPLDVGADLKYTDRETNAAGMFNTNERVDIVLPINSPGDSGATVVPAGTSINYPESNLGNPTEQVFLYQGTVGTAGDGGGQAELIWGMQISTGGIWVATRDDGMDLSELPTTLIGNKNVALASGTSVAFAYDVSKGTMGTKAQLQALISNPANWVQGATVTCPGNFIVVPDEIDAGADGSAVDAPTGSDGGTGGMIGTGDSGPAPTRRSTLAVVPVA